jgi:hypothetical protein
MTNYALLVNWKNKTATSLTTCHDKDGMIEALLDLKQHRKNEQRYYYECIVCKARIPTKHKVKYRYDVKIKQGDAATRDMVKAGRRHCQKYHDGAWVWNLVPECGTLRLDDPMNVYDEAPLDGLLHQALKTAATKTFLPIKHDVIELFGAFTERLIFAKCWLRFCPRTYQILKSLGNRSALRDCAIRRLDEILHSTRTYMRSPEFQERMNQYSYENIVNLLQLFCVEIGRYKRCGILLEPSLFEIYRQLPEKE